MPKLIRQRLAFICAALNRRSAKVALIIWGAISLWDTFVDQFLPESWQKELPRAYDILSAMSGFLPIWAWAILGLFIALVFVTEFGVRKVAKPKGHTQENKNCPDILIIPPEHVYTLFWDPPENLQPATKIGGLEPSHYPLGTPCPVFRIKNIGRSSAKAIEMMWSLDGFDLVMLNNLYSNEIIARKYIWSLSESYYQFKHERPGGHITSGGNYKNSESVKMPYLVPVLDNETHTQVPIPSLFWNYIKILMVPHLCRKAPLKEVSLVANVTVSWKEPMDCEAQCFEVAITASSALPSPFDGMKINIDGELRPPPEVMATLKFEVSDVTR